MIKQTSFTRVHSCYCVWEALKKPLELTLKIGFRLRNFRLPKQQKVFMSYKVLNSQVIIIKNYIVNTNSVPFKTLLLSFQSKSKSAINNYSDYNGTQTHFNLVRKRTLCDVIKTQITIEGSNSSMNLFSKPMLSPSFQSSSFKNNLFA